MIRRPPRPTQSRSSAASDVYKRQVVHRYKTGLYLALDILHREVALVLLHAVHQHLAWEQKVALVEAPQHDPGPFDELNDLVQDILVQHGDQRSLTADPLGELDDRVPAPVVIHHDVRLFEY